MQPSSNGYTYFQKNSIIFAKSEMLYEESFDIPVGIVLERRENETVEDHVNEYKQWLSIKDATESNLVLQKAVERVKILYYLSKKNGT